jgi:hypothetical protein
MSRFTSASIWQPSSDRATSHPTPGRARRCVRKTCTHFPSPPGFSYAADDSSSHHIRTYPHLSKEGQWAIGARRRAALLMRWGAKEGEGIGGGSAGLDIWELRWHRRPCGGRSSWMASSARRMVAAPSKRMRAGGCRHGGCGVGATRASARCNFGRVGGDAASEGKAAGMEAATHVCKGEHVALIFLRPSFFRECIG